MWWQVKAEYHMTYEPKLVSYCIFAMDEEFIASFPPELHNLAITVMQRHNETIKRIEDDRSNKGSVGGDSSSA